MGADKNRVFTELGFQFSALTEEISQHRIDQAFGPGALELGHCSNSFIDRRVIGDTGVHELIESAGQQTLNLKFFFAHGFLHQLLQQQLNGRIPAQGAKTELFKQADIFFSHLAGVLGKQC